VKTLPTWTVTVKMQLGREKTFYVGSVDLNGDVRSVLSKMIEVRTESQGAIENAYNSILASCSKDFSQRFSKTKRSKKE
jgi:hypothetical protein